MPKKNTKMLSNKKALEAGVNRAMWKIEMGQKYFNGTVKYKIQDVTFFDHREAATVAALLIDISSVANESDTEKEKFYIAELKKFEENFVFSKDSQVKHRFMESLCGALATHIDIDWNDEAAIEHIVCSLKVQQTPGTTAEKEPLDVFSPYTNKAGVQRLDTISIKNLIHVGKFSNALSARYRDIADRVNCFDGEYPAYRFRMDITEKIQDAIDNGTNMVLIDPTESKAMRDFFLDNEFDIITQKPNYYHPDQIEETHFTDMDAAREFMESFYCISESCINEQLLVRGYVKEEERTDLLLINGKSMTEIINEKKKEFINSLNPDYEASVAARQMLRDALRNGNSVVSLMRANILEGGRVEFTHQEIKVDLDKLNKLERKEKYNVFRRALDVLKIYKIKPKYPSNDERDRNQEKIKAGSEYQNGKKNAEKKFINAYNRISEKTRKEEDERAKKSAGTVDRDKMFKAFPKIYNAAEENELGDINQPTNNVNTRERVCSIAKDIVDNNKIDLSDSVINEDFTKSKNVNLTIK